MRTWNTSSARVSMVAVCGAVAVSGVLAACQLPPPGGPIAAPRVGTSDLAVAYGQNVGHDGVASGSSLKPPLSLRWKVNFDNPTTRPTVSHPIIADGRVFVTSAIYQTTDLVYAFDLATGRRLWGPVAIGGRGLRSGLAYGYGRLIVSNSDSEFRALDPATGRLLWMRDFFGDTDTSPVVARGLVLAQTEVSLYGLNPWTGATVWRAPGGGQSEPAVWGNRFFTQFQEGAYAYDLNGREVWRNVPVPGGGGGGRIMVAHAGRLYGRNPNYNLPFYIYSPDTGKTLGTFDSVHAPSFYGDTSLVTRGATGCLQSCTLHAVDLVTGAERWSYVGDGTTAIAPLVVNDTVYTGQFTGLLSALDARTGATEWSDNVQHIDAVDEHNSGGPLVGLATGGGYLAVPAGEDLRVYGPAGPALSADDNAVIFAATPAGYSGPTARVIIRSTGAQTAVVGGVRIEGTGASAFKVTSTCGGARLAPRSTCQAIVTFRPTGGTTFSATLTADAPAHAVPVHISLQGTTRR